MTRYRTLAAALALVMIVATLAPFGAAAAQSQADDLSLVVSDDRVVTVTAADSAVENATVEVTAHDESYAGAGNYSTDADGEIELPEPDASVTVTIVASTTADSVEIETVLEPADDASENLSIDVSQNGDVIATVTDDGDALENATVNVTTAADEASYDETGEYETDENGTVTLESPNETVEVTFEVTVDGVSAQTTESLESEQDDDEAKDDKEDDKEDNDETAENFGSMVSAFVQNLQTDGPPGLTVSAFVTQNNPSNASDNASPGNASDNASPGNASDNASPGNASDDTSQTSNGTESNDERDRSPPEHAGSSSDDSGGPPEHAGSSSDNGGGPPEHAGP